MSGQKFDHGKVDLTLIPYSALELEARAWEFGAQKYGRDNYREGFPILKITAAVLRHVWAIVRGEDLDPESGLPHAAHARCDLGIILECQRLNTLTDNRYYKHTETSTPESPYVKMAFATRSIESVERANSPYTTKKDNTGTTYSWPKKESKRSFP